MKDNLIGIIAAVILLAVYWLTVGAEDFINAASPDVETVLGAGKATQDR